MAITPITPKEAEAGDHIPDHMIEAVNQLLKEKYYKRSATILQKDIIDRYCTIAKVVDIPKAKQEIFEKGYLNFEKMYELAGWKVEFDKPAYNETYDAKFTFTKSTSNG